MLGSATELAVACRGTALENRQAFEVTTPTGHLVLAIPCTLEEATTLWTAAVDLLPATGWYPVITYDDEYLDCPELAFIGASMPAAPSDGATIERMVDGYFRHLRNPVSEDDMRLELALTQRVLGAAPDIAEVQAVFRDYSPSRLALERWLFDWELAHGSATNREVLDQSVKPLFSREIPGFTNYLCFLPTSNAWQASGYIAYMGGEEDRVAEFSGAVLRWEQEFDAQLALIGSVTAEFAVGRPADTPDKAWQLALEQKAFGRSNQVRFRWLAAGLMTATSWRLYERP
jgi:hypothetical protein